MIAGPQIRSLILLGKRAQTLLPKVRDWVNNNSCVVGEIVLGLFVVITASTLSG